MFYIVYEWLIQIVFVWRKEFKASVPWSLERDPDCLYPPNGVLISPSEKVLTETVPQAKLLAKRNALFITCVNTLACNPYFELLATFRASSSFFTVM